MNNVVGGASAGIDPQLTDKDGNKSPMELGENAGMIPRILRDLYQRMAEASKDVEFTVRVSYVEIYMEKVLVGVFFTRCQVSSVISMRTST